MPMVAETRMGESPFGSTCFMMMRPSAAPKEYFESQIAHRLARSFFNRGKLTSAICIAPAILANAGLLKHKKATSFPSSKETLEAGGAVFTGSGPEAAKKFGERLVEVLKDYRKK